MRAEEFYQAFEQVFTHYDFPLGMRRMAGRVSRWAIPIADGQLRVKFATNPKAPDLLPLWPGEFHCDIEWVTGRGEGKLARSVSIFQYATGPEKVRYGEIQNAAIAKFARVRPPEVPFSLPPYEGPPRANIFEWCYYVDTEDVHAWGGWYGGIIREWVLRFSASPESLDDWCWRVLWPNLPRGRTN